MMFNSLTFAGFAAVFFAGWWLVRGRVTRPIAWGYLVVGSLVFHGWSRWTSTIVLAAVVLVSFGSGRLIARWPGRRSVLALAIAGVLGPLLAFKYLDFLIAQVNALGELAGAGLHVGAVGLVAPLGISFFTLSAISYAIDVHTEEIQPTRNVMEHAAFLAVFPVLMSGPIVRGHQVLPQLAELPATTAEQRWAGLKQITYGLVKKCIIADHIAGFTSEIYDLNAPPASSGLWWFVTALYAIQIYCDFSGYTDIALGLGRWMGLALPENFRHPYLSTSIREFWGRWNISFSSWLRDYIYFPLARVWGGKLGAVSAVMVTFLVSGLWHGAAWTFVVWGMLHGMLLIVEHWSGWDHRIKALPGGRILATLIVFCIISLVLVVFRANDLGQAWSIFKIMFSFERTQYSWVMRDRTSFHEPTWLLLPALFVIVEARHLVDFDSSKLAMAIRDRTKLGWVAIALLLLACVYLRGRMSPFIYAGF
jgi:D-alanyl-lipoteichoic acid acyltransferase DltB (MBOAT superfamily)